MLAFVIKSITKYYLGNRVVHLYIIVSSLKNSISIKKNLSQEKLISVNFIFKYVLKNDIKISYLTERHYKHIHTIKNSRNQLKALATSQSQTSLMKYQHY